MDHKTVLTVHAPQPIGPYSQGTVAGGLVFCAGQLGLDPATGELMSGGITVQTDQALKNLAAVLEAAGSSLHKVVKTTVFLADLATFQDMNAVYATYFAKNAPARSTVQAAALPKGAEVEIEAIAVL